MLTYPRYALATFCFATSVGCLALWWSSFTLRQIYAYNANGAGYKFCLSTNMGAGILSVARLIRSGANGHIANGTLFEGISSDEGIAAVNEWQIRKMRSRGFGQLSRRVIYFPLWYPALVFALAGVGVLRFRRQFSVRSALICVAVVALLLGIVVAS